MKNLTIISAIHLFIFLSSCKDRASQVHLSNTDSLAKIADLFVDSSKRMTEPEFVVIGFLKWYHDNESNLRKIPMINNATGETYDSTKFYSVNFPATETYLNAFTRSGYVSSAFTDLWRKYFKEAENHFKANPQNDGPPENFEFDLVLQSQEVDEDLQNMDKNIVEAKKIRNETATVLLRLYTGRKLNFTLGKVGQTWLIDHIQNATP